MNTDSSLIAVYVGLLVTGLVMSLHCIGMCGPILLGFSQVFVRINGKGSRAWDFLWYHVGRIWTYAMLGFVAGWLGHAVRAGWGRAAGVVIGAIVVLGGVSLLGLIPGVNLDGCTLKRWQSSRWFTALTSGRGVTPRLLLGVVMGFLPCGLVYAVLAVTAALPTPWHAAGGMVVFGLGTVPSLSAVLLCSSAIPVRLRAGGMRLAAVMVIVAGAWMAARGAWPADPDCCHAPNAPLHKDLSKVR